MSNKYYLVVIRLVYKRAKEFQFPKYGGSLPRLAFSKLLGTKLHAHPLFRTRAKS
jgi:hypothetical protein